MSRISTRISLFLSALALLAVGLSACKTRPYKADVVQGNFVSSEQVAALRAGMPKAQVRNILGTPLLTDLFHADRWDYVFTIERAGVVSKPRRLTAYFKGETLEKWEGDAMPSESEFIQSLNSGRKIGKLPPLSASEKELEAFSVRENRRPTATDSIVSPPPSPSVGIKTYPTLEAQ